MMQPLYVFRTLIKPALRHQGKGRNARKKESDSTDVPMPQHEAQPPPRYRPSSHISPLRDAGFRACAIPYSYGSLASLLLNETGWRSMLPPPQRLEVVSSGILPRTKMRVWLRGGRGMFQNAYESTTRREGGLRRSSSCNRNGTGLVLMVYDVTPRR